MPVTVPVAKHPLSDQGAAPEPDEPRVPTEREKVASHIEQQLVQVGFNILQAEAIAEASLADPAGEHWRRAVALVAKGCDHLTAVDLCT